VEFEVRNSGDVNAICPLNQHSVQLSYVTAKDELDFGHVLAGTTATRSITIVSTTSVSLEVSSITSDSALFEPSVTALTIAPYSYDTIDVTFSAPESGASSATLSIASNDPQRPVWEISLIGVGDGPPVILTAPSSFETTLPSGGRDVQLLGLSNNGESALEFSISAEWVAAPLSTTAVFVSLDPPHGSVPPDGALDVDVHIDTTDLAVGSYEANLHVVSNDPASPLLTLPVSLTVLAAPHIQIPDQLVFRESRMDYQSAGATTEHRLPISPPVGGGTLQLAVRGDYRGVARRATMSAEGVTVGNTGNTTADCGQAFLGSFPSASELARLAANGVVDIEVQNSETVGAGCAENSHTVGLTYTPQRDALYFGSVLATSSPEMPISIQNNGTETLEVTAISSDSTEFVPSLTSASIPAGQSQELLVTFTPPAVGEFTGTLGISSNDPDEPLYEILLSGFGELPGGAAVHFLETELQNPQGEDAQLFEFSSSDSAGQQSQTTTTDPEVPELAPAGPERVNRRGTLIRATGGRGAGGDFEFQMQTTTETTPKGKKDQR
jgi:hypothetical protein